MEVSIFWFGEINLVNRKRKYTQLDLIFHEMYFWSSIMCEDGVKDGMLSWDRQCDGSTYVYSKRSK